MTNYFLMQKTEQSTLDTLDAIATIQKHRINEFMNEDIERLNGISTDTDFRQAVLNYLENKNEDDRLKIESALLGVIDTNDNFRQITFYNADGKLLISKTKFLRDLDEASPFFPDAKLRNYITVTSDDGHTALYYSGPVIFNNELLGVISIESDPYPIMTVSTDFTGLGKSGETFLAKSNSDGDAISITSLRFNPDASFSHIIPKNQENPMTQALLSNEIRMNDATDYRGEKVLAVTKYLKNVDWGLVTKIDRSEVLASFYDANVIQIGFVIILSGVVASGSILVTDRVLKPIASLKKGVKELEKGNFNTRIFAHGKNELDSLVFAFEQLQKVLDRNRKKTVTVQERLQQKLKERDDLMRSLDNSSIVSITDKNGSFVYVNKKFEDVTRFNQEELLGKKHQVLFSKEFSQESYQELWRTISSGNVWKGDIKMRTKDNNWVWTHTTITPFIKDYGKPEQYIFVSTEITELIDQKELILSQFKELQKVDIRKEEFASMVSHELKTPITPIKFNTEMLLEPGVLGDLTQDQKDAVKEIELNTKRLENLISDILYAQRLDMNRMVFNKNKFKTETLVGQISKNLSSLMVEKQIEFNIQDSYANYLESDENRIQQILENLIKNSIDFVPEIGGKITVGIKNFQDYVLFYVKDNGIGIPKNKQKNLFKKFYQVDTSHTRKHGGTGLGLVISKGFVEGLGGKIWCESDEGKGTSFFFTIPKKQEIELKTNG